MPHTTLAESYAYSESVARQQAGNFYPAFRVLPGAQRRAMCALYAFLRFTDDIADGPADVATKRSELAAWREGLHAALAGDDRHPVYPALRDAVERFAIPAWYLETVIDGVAMDLAPISFQRFADLYRYCFHVASAVGLACIHVWGFRGDDAKRLAEDAGIGFQLTNIIRDLGEDLERGRVYWPAEDFALFHCSPEQLRQGSRDPAVNKLLHYEADRARYYYQSAEKLIPLLTRPGRAVFQIMLRIYRGLLDEIERSGFDVFDRRVSLSRWKKMGFVLQAVPVRWGWGGSP